MLVLTNRGVITHTDEGWSLRCNEAYAVNTSEQVTLLGHDPSWGFALATPSSVLSSSDEGCGWAERSPTAGASVSAALATTSRWYLATGLTDDAPALHVRSPSDGAWQALWTSEDDTWIDSLAQAPSAPERLYATFAHPNYETRTLEPAWGSSIDGGRSWTRRALAAPWQAVGVHPSQPDVVFAQEPLADGSFALRRSADAGETFVDVAQGLSSFGPLVKGPDGLLWLGGGAKGGLLTSDDEGQTFDRAHPEVVSVRCLVFHDRSLYACANVLDQGEGVYRVDDAATWTRVLSFEDVRAQTACAGRAICDAAFGHWQSEVLADETTEQAHDAGPGHDHDAHDHTHDADGGAATSKGPEAATASGCAALPAPARSRRELPLLLLGLLLYSVFVRRNSSQRPTPPPRP
jgi:hypothetical protein